MFPCVTTLLGVAQPFLLGTMSNKLFFNSNHLLICWPHYTWMLKFLFINIFYWSITDIQHYILVSGVHDSTFVYYKKIMPISIYYLSPKLQKNFFLVWLKTSNIYLLSNFQIHNNCHQLHLMTYVITFWLEVCNSRSPSPILPTLKPLPYPAQTPYSLTMAANPFLWVFFYKSHI